MRERSSKPRRRRIWWMLLVQSIRSIARRPGRALATAVGIALGVGVFIVTIGLSASAGAQINATFDELSATLLRISDADDQAATGLFTEFRSGPTFDQAVGGIAGVVDGGELWLVDSSVPIEPRPGESFNLDLIAVSPGALRAVEANLAWGRIYDDFGSQTPVVMLGHQAAITLGIDYIADVGVRTVLIDGRRALVAGVLANAGAAPELANGVLIPPRDVSLLRPHAVASQAAVVRTELGAVPAVAPLIPHLIEPENPSRVGILVPPEPQQLRESVQGSVQSLALAVAGFSVVVGALGITNSMLTAVNQRAGEIGLRRTLGGSAGWVLLQFLVEGAVLGLLGGTLGACGGVIALAVAAALNGLTPVLSLPMAMVMPAVGGLIGMVASSYPATRAALTTPADSLRR